MAKTYAAGIVTAYGAAVRGGYQGTYEDYCQEMYQLLAKKSTAASLTETKLVANSGLVDVVGIPEYVEDISTKADYGITSRGWYVFARLTAAEDTTVDSHFAISGQDGLIQPEEGDDHVDIAVRFDVAAMSKVISVTWNEWKSETFTFRATDLSARNLEYRVTFYIYDISPYTTWEYALTTDKTFAADKKYYTQEADGSYTLAEVTAGNPAIYYERGIGYALTADTTFQDGKTYYTKEGDNYIVATVTVGDAVTANTYYEQIYVYTQTEDTTFAYGKTYYTSDGTTYTEAVVTAGDPITVYYVHSKVTFAGMAKNVTYRLDEMVDCPIEITLPEIADDGHGAWFEIQMRYQGSHSCTLLPPEGVKIGTAQTQAQTAGINTIDLQYTDVDDVQMWTLLNTHSNIPTT